jgi:CarD family transcriptional regulator
MVPVRTLATDDMTRSNASVRSASRPPSSFGGAPKPDAPLAPLVPAPSFKIGDKAVHPAHGLAEVTAIETRSFGGTDAVYYILRIFDNGMKVMVPIAAATQVGLRYAMSAREADAVLATMGAHEVAVDLQPWSRRFRAYTEMLKSGSPHEVAKVLRDMHRLRFEKDLSFGERRLLDQAKSLLVKELALAKQVPEAKLLEEMAKIFSG